MRHRCRRGRDRRSGRGRDHRCTRCGRCRNGGFRRGEHRSGFRRRQQRRRRVGCRGGRNRCGSVGRTGIRRRLPRAVVLHRGHAIQSVSGDSFPCRSADEAPHLTKPGFKPRTNAYSPVMHVAITGASGLIGTALTSHLRRNGHQVTPLVRRTPRAGEIGWDPSAGRLEPDRSRTDRRDRAPRRCRHRRPPVDR